MDAMLYIAQTGCHWRYLPQSLADDLDRRSCRLSVQSCSQT